VYGTNPTCLGGQHRCCLGEPRKNMTHLMGFGVRESKGQRAKSGLPEKCPLKWLYVCVCACVCLSNITKLFSAEEVIFW